MAWNGTNSVIPRVIVPFAAPASVSTLTPLYSLAELGNSYKDLIFTVRNHDALLSAAMYVYTSEGGVVVDAQVPQAIIPPLDEVTLIFEDVLHLYWALSASGNPNGGFAALNISFQISGRWRRDV